MDPPGPTWTQVFYTRQETRFWAQEMFNQNGQFYRVQRPKNDKSAKFHEVWSTLKACLNKGQSAAGGEQEATSGHRNSPW